MSVIRRGWLHLASGAGFGRIFGLASNLMLSRWLGPNELGLFNLITTTVQTSDTLVRCGGDYSLNFELGGKPLAIRTERGAQLVAGLAQLCSLTTLLICIGVAVWVWWGQGLFPSTFETNKRLLLGSFLLVMIACEGCSASAWEVLLVSHRTASFALRQGLFFPLRLLFAAVGTQFGDVLGAMGGWCLISVLQCFWLKLVLRNLWKPLAVLPLLRDSLCCLLKRGFPFYVANLMASLIFYPLLLKVASGSGLSEVGYLRVGQILQQLFAFLPATLVPVLFLKLRAQSSFVNQVFVMEKPFRLIWFLLLEILLLYCVIDQTLITWIFGAGFLAAMLPTRLLLITALFECLAQLVVQPLLAAGKTRIYGLCQNGAAILAAVLGWLWIPNAGLAAYLIVRLLYIILPLIAFGIPVFQKFHELKKILPLILVTLGLLAILLIQVLTDFESRLIPLAFAVSFISILILQRQDLFVLRQSFLKE